jgi:hypothetical protein
MIDGMRPIVFLNFLMFSTRYGLSVVPSTFVFNIETADIFSFGIEPPLQRGIEGRFVREPPVSVGYSPESCRDSRLTNPAISLQQTRTKIGHRSASVPPRIR